MTVTAPPTWRPFHDEPLFTTDLLHGLDAMPDAVRDRLVTYLEQVAARRRAPLHVTTAFNALHFGFDLETGGYRAAVLDPELFVRLTPGDHAHPPLPVGTFVRLERGRQSLWAEVVARFGAHPDVDGDGWVPPALSGAPTTGDPNERVVLDPEAFGAPLTPTEQAELNRLRRRGMLLDDRGHLTGPVHYTAPETASDDDTAAYARHLLTEARPLIVGGPLGGLLTDSAEDAVLDLALRIALETVDELLTQAPGLRRWGAYATTVDRYRWRRDSHNLLGGADLNELVHAATRATGRPRFTGVWPLLAARVDDARTCDPDEFDADPLELTAAADAVVHANLALANLATHAINGLLPGGVHLRIDDLWQAGGVWLAQRMPVPADVLAADPLRPLGLGSRLPQPTGVSAGSERGDSTSGDPPADGPRSGERDPETAAGQDATAGLDPITKTAWNTDANRNLDQIPEPARDPEPGPAPREASKPEPAGEGDSPDIEKIDDTIVVYTFALRESHIDDDLLPLPTAGGDLAADGHLIIELHHDGAPLLEDERVQRVERDAGQLRGIAWPLSFYPGIKVTVALARGARRLSAATTLLADPLPYGDGYRWAADLRVLAAALGLATPEGSPDPADGAPPPRAASPVPDRYRGIDALRGLIISALRRHGVEGGFGARRLTGPQLLAALFGADLVSPALLWQVIYTCERLADDGKITCEPNPARPDRPGSGGPDTFVWWPNDTARRQAARRAQAAHRDRLAGQVREHWVPPFLRLLPAGYRASEQARQAYADYIRALRGLDTDRTLPVGYTFVRAHPRGGDPGPLWLPSG